MKTRAKNRAGRSEIRVKIPFFKMIYSFKIFIFNSLTFKNTGSTYVPHMKNICSTYGK
jgi:hypothetical protein